MDAANTLVLDVDGTLVDTNYQHALAWFQAFRRHGVTVPIWRIHRAIGMGGDRLVAHVAGDEVERRLGDQVRDEWKRAYGLMIDAVCAFDGARDLVVAAKKLGYRVVLATSGDPGHLEHYLEMLALHDVVDAWTSAEDVSDSKPSPDLLHVALSKVNGSRAVLIGDSTWDCAAAERAGLPCVALRTGGFDTGELMRAGAVVVFDALPELQAHLSELPFGSVK